MMSERRFCVEGGFVTSNQVSCHVGDAAAGLPHGSDRDRVAVATKQSFQLTVGGAVLAGHVVTRCSCCHESVC